MTYATLMVHVEPGQSNAALLHVAADLADRFHAGVIGIAACQPVQVVYGDGYVPDDLIERDRVEIEGEMKKAEAEFRDVLEPRVANLDWRSTMAFAPLSDYLSREARRADLFITGVAAGGFFDGSRQGNTGDLVMQIGRPVLIVPATGSARRFDRFVIGWKDTRETRRAVADALPLLKKAVHVAVVEIATDEDLARARAGVADVVSWLGRHDIVAEAVAALSTGDDASQLDDVAREHGADVIVAGAYGHSRLREWALGGVTRDLLIRTDRCTLLAH